MFEARTPEEIADTLRRFHKDALSGIIAIDGMDGAGKDCLALNLQKLLGGGIVSLDRFIKQKNQGGYMPYLDLPAIREAIEICATPKIIAGCCALAVLNSIGQKQDVLIYAKKVIVRIYPDGSRCDDWLDEELIHHKKAVAEHDTVTKEFIRYHDVFNPLRIAAIAFPHLYRPHKDSNHKCPFHLGE